MPIIAKLKSLPSYSQTKKRRPIAKGEKHASAKLTNKDVEAIRASLKPAKEIALEYGVSKSHILNLRACRVRAGN